MRNPNCIIHAFFQFSIESTISYLLAILKVLQIIEIQSYILQVLALVDWFQIIQPIFLSSAIIKIEWKILIMYLTNTTLFQSLLYKTLLIEILQIFFNHPHLAYTQNVYYIHVLLHSTGITISQSSAYVTTSLCQYKEEIFASMMYGTSTLSNRLYFTFNCR